LLSRPEQALWFGISGAAGVAWNFGLTWLLIRFGVQKYLANTLGLASASILNYLLLRHFTFTSEAPLGREALRYYLVFALALVINHGLVWLLHEKVRWGLYLSKAVAVGILFVLKYVAHNLFTFV